MRRLSLVWNGCWNVKGYTFLAGAFVILVAISNTAAANPLPPTVPTPPTDFNITPDPMGKVSLAWGAPLYDGNSDIVLYKVYKDGSPLGTVGPAVTEFLDSSGTPGTLYSVAAINAMGEGAAAIGLNTPPPPCFAVVVGVPPIQVSFRSCVLLIRDAVCNTVGWNHVVCTSVNNTAQWLIRLVVCQQPPCLIPFNSGIETMELSSRTEANERIAAIEQAVRLLIQDTLD